MSHSSLFPFKELYFRSFDYVFLQMSLSLSQVSAQRQIIITSLILVLNEREEKSLLLDKRFHFPIKCNVFITDYNYAAEKSLCLFPILINVLEINHNVITLTLRCETAQTAVCKLIQMTILEMLPSQQCLLHSSIN